MINIHLLYISTQLVIVQSSGSSHVYLYCRISNTNCKSRRRNFTFICLVPMKRFLALNIPFQLNFFFKKFLLYAFHFLNAVVCEHLLIWFLLPVACCHVYLFSLFLALQAVHSVISDQQTLLLFPESAHWKNTHGYIILRIMEKTPSSRQQWIMYGSQEGNCSHICRE